MKLRSILIALAILVPVSLEAAAAAPAATLDRAVLKSAILHYHDALHDPSDPEHERLRAEMLQFVASFDGDQSVLARWARRHFAAVEEFFDRDDHEEADERIHHMKAAITYPALPKPTLVSSLNKLLSLARDPADPTAKKLRVAAWKYHDALEINESSLAAWAHPLLGVVLLRLAEDDITAAEEMLEQMLEELETLSTGRS